MEREEQAMNTCDKSNKELIQQRAEAHRNERIMEHAFTLMEDAREEVERRKEEKWTKEWALFEYARVRGYQPSRLDSLKKLEKVLWSEKVVAGHSCDAHCQQYSNRGRRELFRFHKGKRMDPKNKVFVCMSTGNVHLCDSSPCGRQVSIEGGHKRLGYRCIISGIDKASILSDVRFGGAITSTKKMADAEKEEEENGRGMGEEVEDAPSIGEDNSEVENSEDKEANVPTVDVFKKEKATTVVVPAVVDMEEAVVDIEAAMDMIVPVYGENDTGSKRIKLRKDIITTTLKRAKIDLKQLDEQEKRLRETIANDRSTRISYGTATRKLRKVANQLSVGLDTLKKRKQSEEPVFMFNKARAVLAHQTPEQKTERYLRKGTISNAVDFLELLCSPDSKNRLVLYRTDQIEPQLTRDLTDLMRQYTIPYDILLGTYFRQVQRRTGMALHYAPALYDMKLYARYIIAHWYAAAHTTYANSKHGGAANKQKHHQVLEFHLFCIGMIYYMADGGFVLEERLERKFPESLKHYEDVLVKRGFKIQEIPSFPELNEMLINRDFLHELSKCLPRFPTYQIGVEKSGQQLVQNCIRSRHTMARDRFYAAITEEPQKLDVHFKLYLASNLPLVPIDLDEIHR